MSENEKLNNLIRVIKQQYTPQYLHKLQQQLDSNISRVRYASIICPLITFISGIVIGLNLPKLLAKLAVFF